MCGACVRIYGEASQPASLRCVRPGMNDPARDEGSRHYSPPRPRAAPTLAGHRLHVHLADGPQQAHAGAVPGRSLPGTRQAELHAGQVHADGPPSARRTDLENHLPDIGDLKRMGGQHNGWDGAVWEVC